MITEYDFEIENYEVLKEEYNTKIHPGLRKKIIEMRESDQLYRGRKTQYLMDHKKAQDSIDKKNRNKIIEIFNSIGYPTYHKLGEEPYATSNSYNIRIILLHTPDEIRE